LRKLPGAVEKTALDWNPHGARRCGRPRKTSRKTVEGKARKATKTWNEVKRLANNRNRWRSYAPEGATETNKKKKRLFRRHPSFQD
jgi:hypothetical protein